MELKVIKSFNGKAEGKTLCPGDVIQSNDVERINTLVRRGFCVIVALDSPTPDTNETVNDESAEKSTIDFRGNAYPLDTMKEALGSIGVRVAHNAKEKAVGNALAALTDEQVEALAIALTTTTESD